MKYVLCGGGTSGHVMPAIAIADALKKYDENAEILFVGRRGGKENRSFLKSGHTFTPIEVYPLSISLSKENFKRLIKNLKSFKSADEILENFRPDAVIGTGGYVCFPVIKSASKRKIPCFMHESNSIAGKSAKYTSKYCRCVFTGYRDCIGFPKKANLKYTGTPVRNQFKDISKTASRRELGVKEGEFFIFSFGGSGGARKLNEVMLDVIRNYSSVTKGVRHIHVCGEKYYQEIDEKLKQFTLPFTDDIHTYISASDLVISRSGALTIAELAHLKKASILIPSPNVTANHQYKNAKVISDADGAVLIEEKELNTEKLIKIISSLREDLSRRIRLSRCISRFSNPQAENEISEIVIKSLKSALPRNKY